MFACVVLLCVSYDKQRIDAAMSLQYRATLEAPWVLIVWNMESIRIVAAQDTVLVCCMTFGCPPP
jgi:hypothetical protein